MAVLLSSLEMESGSGDVGRIDPATLWERDELNMCESGSWKELITSSADMRWGCATQSLSIDGVHRVYLIQ